MVEMMSIDDEEFRTIRELVYRSFGINLTEEKRSLVVGRLQKLIRSRGFETFSDYYKHVVEDSSGKALNELATRISTNHTFFFRENEHFKFFVQKALPEAVRRQEQRGGRDIRIWSAGCSSGEEPYTLVMLMQEHFGSRFADWDAGVLATDISEKVLAEALSGRYPPDRLAQLPEELRRRNFSRVAEGAWQISEGVRKRVTFRRFNLMNEKFPFKRQFDMIFCRNVMIYFDRPTRDKLVQRFYDWTVPGGYLFIGHSESLPRGECPYRYLQPALYQKEGRES